MTPACFFHPVQAQNCRAPRPGRMLAHFGIARITGTHIERPDDGR